MPEFIVRVGTPDGNIVERHVNAMTVRAAEEELRRQGMQIFKSKRGARKLRDFFHASSTPSEDRIMAGQCIS